MTRQMHPELDNSDLIEQLQEACYEDIEPHLAQGSKETDRDRLLALMAPSHYGEFARQACLRVAAIVVTATNQTDSYDEAVSFLAPCLTNFGEELASYGRCHEHLMKMLAGFFGETCRRSWEAGEMGAQLGGLSGLLASMGAGFFASRRVQKELEAEGTRLDEQFRRLLDSYDEAMEGLANTAIEFVEQMQ
jgi:hypothetical protein